MDTSNGKIYDEEIMKKLLEKDPEVTKRLRQMVLEPTKRQWKKMKIGRNDPCPCGAKDKNGKPIKFKKCCLNKV